ncbi:ABC transporter substrate-binding protein [Nocardia sp. NEAU-G5]|uniref:ABC transporter substrate-binding protein n=1 Tax=Nocardia albiluteola TaxID=2842303 RepID=A0ABS6B654_9NOCA|nr:ABC transporter substrate-binding protein [Nocardia albiluteola]MBU3064825.1 ABC transporter substrate-binding protein [Nocardia albiluteola]
MVTRRAVLQAGLILPFAGACAPEILRGSSGALRIAVSWSGSELEAFRAVLDGVRSGRSAPQFTDPVEVVPLGDDIDTALTAGRDAPDIVMLPDAGRIQDLAGTTLRAMHESLWAPDGVQRYPDSWWNVLWHTDPRARQASLFGLPFKSANMSLVWYDREAFPPDDPPREWCLADWSRKVDEYARGDRRLFALGAADGWVLAYHFSNVLRAIAREEYESLAKSPAGWDRPEVRTTLHMLGAIWGHARAFPGGVADTLRRQFPDAVRDVFLYGRAAMVVAPDYAEPIVRECLRRTGRGESSVGVMPFPAFRRAEYAVAPRIGGGDVMVVTSAASERADDLVAALAAPSAPEPWVTRYGGFVQPRLDAPEPASYYGVFEPVHAQMNSWDVFDFADLAGPRGRRNGLWRILTRFLTDVGGHGSAAVDAATEHAIGDLEQTWL